MSSRYVYPGSRSDFYNEFGGVPDKSIKPENMFLIMIVIIIIIVMVLLIALALSRTFITYITRTDLVNLDNLLNLNNPSTTCCVFPGDTAPNEQYVYDTGTNITYSRAIPFSIDTVCNTFPNPTTCKALNTDANGNIIPIATFNASPYYTFENGLFVGCASTTTCA